MLGMMNQCSDAVEFYSAPNSRSGTLNAAETKVFVEHKEKKKVSYTEDGRKMIDGKIVENSSDDESSPTLNPQQMWEKLIVTSVVTGNIQKPESISSSTSPSSLKSNKTKPKK
uniref:Uncharacterized protein n=1 Tax=Panagrolaimus sp. PS1159 TaxID=55785 RepID=A0AC35G8N4_9BILA